MGKFSKKAGEWLIPLFLVVFLASGLAFAGPGKGKGKGHGHGGVPDVALALMVGTGLVSVGLYAKKKHDKK
jgi:hypothetical protein